MVLKSKMADRCCSYLTDNRDFLLKLLVSRAEAEKSLCQTHKSQPLPIMDSVVQYLLNHSRLEITLVRITECTAE